MKKEEKEDIKEKEEKENLDKLNNYNFGELVRVTLDFGDGSSVYFEGEEGKMFCAHYINGLQLRNLSRIPIPKPVVFRFDKSSAKVQ